MDNQETCVTFAIRTETIQNKNNTKHETLKMSGDTDTKTVKISISSDGYC